VDDQEVTRTGLSYGLQAKAKHLDIVGEAENGEQALTLVQEKKPHVVLMDIQMPVMDGITATRQIKAHSQEVKVIMLTSYSVEEEVYASLAGGADAYCLKDIKMELLLHVMGFVVDGGSWLDPAIARMVFNALPSKQQPGKETRKQYNTNLTEREMEVLELIVAGNSNKEIAQILGLSMHTVKTHVCNIIQKLAVDDRTQAAVKALQSGMIQK
jgi:DNA-binding NarL/FixJ family response regulator